LHGHEVGHAATQLLRERGLEIALGNASSPFRTTRTTIGFSVKVHRRPQRDGLRAGLPHVPVVSHFPAEA